MSFSHFEKRTVACVQLPGLKRKYYWLQEPVVAVMDDGSVRVTPSGRIIDAHSIPAVARIFTGHFVSIMPAGDHDENFLTGRVPRKVADSDYRKALLWFDEARRRTAYARAGLWLGSWHTYNRYARLRAKYGADKVLSYHWAESEAEAIERAKKGLSRVLF